MFRDASRSPPFRSLTIVDEENSLALASPHRYETRVASIEDLAHEPVEGTRVDARIGDAKLHRGVPLQPSNSPLSQKEGLALPKVELREVATALRSPALDDAALDGSAPDSAASDIAAPACRNEASMALVLALQNPAREAQNAASSPARDDDVGPSLGSRQPGCVSGNDALQPTDPRVAGPLGALSQERREARRGVASPEVDSTSSLQPAAPWSGAEVPAGEDPEPPCAAAVGGEPASAPAFAEAEGRAPLLLLEGAKPLPNVSMPGNVSASETIDSAPRPCLARITEVSGTEAGGDAPFPLLPTRQLASPGATGSSSAFGHLSPLISEGEKVVFRVDAAFVVPLYEWENWSIVLQARALKVLLSEYVDPSDSVTSAIRSISPRRVCPDTISSAVRTLVRAVRNCRPLVEGRWVLHADASNTGIGGFLSLCGYKKRAVAFAFRRLSKKEKKLNITERETLAVMYCLDEFRPLTRRSDVLVRSDNTSVCDYFDDYCAPLARKLNIAFERDAFRIDLCHISGDRNIVADALSRAE